MSRNAGDVVNLLFDLFKCLVGFIQRLSNGGNLNQINRPAAPASQQTRSIANRDQVIVLRLREQPSQRRDGFVVYATDTQCLQPAHQCDRQLVSVYA